jgi:hypothetical protein
MVRGCSLLNRGLLISFVLLGTQFSPLFGKPV